MTFKNDDRKFDNNGNLKLGFLVEYIFVAMVKKYLLQTLDWDVEIITEDDINYEISKLKNNLRTFISNQFNGICLEFHKYTNYTPDLILINHVLRTIIVIDVTTDPNKIQQKQKYQIYAWLLSRYYGYNNVCVVVAYFEEGNLDSAQLYLNYIVGVLSRRLPAIDL